MTPNIKQPEVAPEKKTYKTPDLIEHGTVEKITGMPGVDEDLSPIVDG